MDRSPLLQTANEIESFIEFCFPSFKQQLNCNYTQGFAFFFYIISRRKKVISSYYSISDSNMKMKMFVYSPCRGYVLDPACTAVGGRAPVAFHETGLSA